MLEGILILLFAGICQGSFGLGYKKYTPFSWAAFWGIYCLLCIAVSSIAVLILAPGTFSSIFSCSMLLPVSCGALWGLSAVCFSKAITKIGMSMVYGISMGVSTVVGSALPLIMDGEAICLSFIVGLAVTVLGIIVITIAGIIRDGGFKASAAGIIMSFLSGLGSGAMNIGFLHSGYIDSYFASEAAVSAAKWLPVLVGGCIAGMIYCAVEVTLKNEWNTVTAKGSLKRIGVLFIVSVVWYLALLLYGLSVGLMGSLGESVGWILFNSLALIISVFWGIKSGEWKGKDKKILFMGCAVLILAWIVIAVN